MLVGALDGRWPAVIRTWANTLQCRVGIATAIEMRRRVLLAVAAATGSAASMLSTDREPFGVDRLLDGCQR
jgi:hypothetical protein